MYTILYNSIFDYIILYSNLITIFLVFLLNVVVFFKTNRIKKLKKSIDESNIDKKRIYYAFFIVLLISAILSIFVFKKISKINTLMSFILIIIIFYYSIKGFKSIRANNFFKAKFSDDEKYSILFSETLFIFFLSSFACKILFLSFNTLSFNEGFFLILIILIKLILIIFYSIFNLIISFKTIYKIINVDFIKIIEIRINKINLFANDYNFFTLTIKIQDIVSSKSNTKFLEFIDKFFWLIIIPIGVISIYIIELVKKILIIILFTLLKPLKLFKSLLENEILFSNKLIKISTFLSLIIIYVIIINTDILNHNSISFYEFLATAIIIPIVIDQINQIRIYKNKMHDSVILQESQPNF